HLVRANTNSSAVRFQLGKNRNDPGVSSGRLGKPSPVYHLVGFDDGPQFFYAEDDSPRVKGALDKDIKTVAYECAN
ncbi:hypothetical protein ABTF85_19480, partial [Acinetobacter baumannii]